MLFCGAKKGWLISGDNFKVSSHGGDGWNKGKCFLLGAENSVSGIQSYLLDFVHKLAATLLTFDVFQFGIPKCHFYALHINSVPVNVASSLINLRYMSQGYCLPCASAATHSNRTMKFSLYFNFQLKQIYVNINKDQEMDSTYCFLSVLVFFISLIEQRRGSLTILEFAS